MRLFLAINIPKDVKKMLERRFIKVKREVSEELKWVEKTNWHITIKFFGEMEIRESEKIKEQLKTSVHETKQQIVSFSRIAAFPDLAYPRVFYIGIGQGKASLLELHERLEKSFVKINLKSSKNNFLPHLTIARTKRNTNIKQLAVQLKQFTNFDFSDIIMNLGKVSLMKSILQKNGPHYEELYSIKL